MPLWRANTGRVQSGQVGDVVAVFSGSLRSPHEIEALIVVLGIRDGEITMHTGETELGRWPAAAVDLRRLGATAFEFTAEGDRLIFTPDEPDTFGDSPIVVGQDADTGNRKRRRSKKRSDEAEPKVVWEQDSLEEQRPAVREPKQEPTKGRARKRSQRHRKAATESAGSEHDSLNVAPVVPPPVLAPVDATADSVRPGAESTTLVGRREGQTSEADDARSAKPKKTSNGMWIRALDVARKYDTFGLDRVPIDESLRGREHQHTWDHRVAASSGLGKHICTICGAIRRG